jgi:C1A family cysteine protease
MPIRGTYGWKRDEFDARDMMFTAPMHISAALPAKVDLRPQCPPVYDQGQLGSCTANAIGGAIQFEQKKQQIPDFTPSRLFIYYNERVIEKDVPQDAGAQIRDGMKSVSQQGAPPEEDWPYEIAKFALKPPANAYIDALQNRVLAYSRISQDVVQMKSCLASGYPFVFGIQVYSSFESEAVATTGTVPLPHPGKEKLLGGHAIMCVGYDDSASVFLVRNSWGPDWGKEGYCTLPYQYLLAHKLADDFWTIRLMSQTAAAIDSTTKTTALSAAA